MKVVDFEGRENTWPPSGYTVDLDDKRPRSTYHKRCRELLSKMYQFDNILEELPLPGIRLFLDFYIPKLNLAIEVHGEQHYAYNPYMHGSKLGFLASRSRDQKKKEWCEMNGITFLELSYADDDDKWKGQIGNS